MKNEEKTKRKKVKSYMEWSYGDSMVSAKSFVHFVKLFLQLGRSWGEA